MFCLFFHFPPTRSHAGASVWLIKSVKKHAGLEEENDDKKQGLHVGMDSKYYSLTGVVQV